MESNYDYAEFEKMMKVVVEHISNQPNPKMRIGIVGSGISGAFAHIPSVILERPDVVIIDTDGKKQDDLLQEVKTENVDIIVEVPCKKEISKEIALEIKQPPKLEIPSWSYSDFDNKHKGQPWAQMRKGKNRRFK